MTNAKTALVTGGARRIGGYFAEMLGELGWTVAIHCNASVDDALVLAARLRHKGGRAEVFAADLASAAEVDALVPDVVERLGPVTLLINSASVFEPDAMPGLRRASYDHALAVNFSAPIWLTEAFARALPADEDGLVVHMLDQRVFKPTPTFLSYSLAKQALYGAVPMLAQALAPRIRVNAIAPGPTLKSRRQHPEDFALQAGATLLGHGSPLEDLGSALRFLIEARSVTGLTLAVDGGQHLLWQTPDVVRAGE